MYLSYLIGFFPARVFFHYFSTLFNNIRQKAPARQSARSQACVAGWQIIKNKTKKGQFSLYFEPPVPLFAKGGLQNRCPACLRLSPRSGLNRQPTVYKTVALPLSYMGLGDGGQVYLGDWGQTTRVA
jgi:hypothetical protein